MAVTPTTNIELGFALPAFELTDTISGRTFKHNDIRGEKGTLVMFICNHCPYVLHIIKEIVQIGYDYRDKGLGIVAISSNDILKYPEDNPQRMKEFGVSLGFPFPYLFDESQEIAKAYDAACTPDFNFFDSKGNCMYRGQFDGARPGNSIKVTGEDLREAIELVLNNKDVPSDQTPSTGCGIKWK